MATSVSPAAIAAGEARGDPWCCDSYQSCSCFDAHADAESFPPFGSSAHNLWLQMVWRSGEGRMTYPKSISRSGGVVRIRQALSSIIKPDLLRHLFSFTPPQQARHVVSDGNLFLLQPGKYTKNE